MLFDNTFVFFFRLIVQSHFLLIVLNVVFVEDFVKNASYVKKRKFARGVFHDLYFESNTDMINLDHWILRKSLRYFTHIQIT